MLHTLNNCTESYDDPTTEEKVILTSFPQLLQQHELLMSA